MFDIKPNKKFILLNFWENFNHKNEESKVCSKVNFPLFLFLEEKIDDIRFEFFA